MTEPVEGGPVFRDRRRIDPETYEVREPPSEGGPAPEGEGSGGSDGGQDETSAAPAGPDSALLDAELAELTSDLQRLSAEYTNYRRRVERDRDVVRETAVASALSELLPVLDDIGRARQHGELEGAFKAVGEALEQAVARLGLESFAGVGEAFDPVVHEALTAVPTRRARRAGGARGLPAGLPLRRSRRTPRPGGRHPACRGPPPEGGSDALIPARVAP